MSGIFSQPDAMQALPPPVRMPEFLVWGLFRFELKVNGVMWFQAQCESLFNCALEIL